MTPSLIAKMEALVERGRYSLTVTLTDTERALATPPTYGGKATSRHLTEDEWRTITEAIAALRSQEATVKATATCNQCGAPVHAMKMPDGNGPIRYVPPTLEATVRECAEIAKTEIDRYIVGKPGVTARRAAAAILARFGLKGEKG